MTPEITELIKKKAEEYASGGSNYLKNHQPKTYDDRFNSYISGQTEGTELMIGFTEWMGQQDLKFYKEGWCQPGGSNGWHESTIYFLDKYICNWAMEVAETVDEMNLFKGLTKREYFVVRAMQALIMRDAVLTDVNIAAKAISFADELLKALKTPI